MLNQREKDIYLRIAKFNIQTIHCTKQCENFVQQLLMKKNFVAILRLKPKEK